MLHNFSRSICTCYKAVTFIVQTCFCMQERRVSFEPYRLKPRCLVKMIWGFCFVFLNVRCQTSLTGCCICAMKLLLLLQQLPSLSASEGCTAARTAAWWDGCVERCNTGQAKSKDVPSRGIYPKATEQQTAQRLPFRLQLVSFVARTSGPSGSGPPACAPQPLTSPPARSPRQVS